jgi:hypothetical protein
MALIGHFKHHCCHAGVLSSITTQCDANLPSAMVPQVMQLTDDWACSLINASVHAAASLLGRHSVDQQPPNRLESPPACLPVVPCAGDTPPRCLALCASAVTEIDVKIRDSPPRVRKSAPSRTLPTPQHHTKQYQIETMSMNL